MSAMCLIAVDPPLIVQIGVTDLTAPKSSFRFAPESGLKSNIAPCPGSAICVTSHCRKQRAFSPSDRRRAGGTRRQPSFGFSIVVRGGLHTRCLTRYIGRAWLMRALNR